MNDEEIQRAAKGYSSLTSSVSNREEVGKAYSDGVYSPTAKDYWYRKFREENQLTFEQFVQQWNEVILPKKDKHIRKGQSLMNFLGEKWLPEYKRLSSVNFYDKSNIDCFYNDNLIQNTLNHLESVWYQYPN